MVIFLAHRSFFNEIANGTKREHYVEIREPWIKRALEGHTVIEFKIGRGEHLSEVAVECNEWIIKEVMNEKTGIAQQVFAIQLGEVLDRKNIIE